MNRKASGLPMILILFLVSLVVLVIVLMSLGYFGSWTLPFFNWIPDPENNTDPDVSQTIGLLVKDNGVEYYDGLRWVPIGNQKAYRVGKRVLDPAMTKEDFVGKWYSQRGLPDNLGSLKDVKRDGAESGWKFIDGEPIEVFAYDYGWTTGQFTYMEGIERKGFFKVDPQMQLYYEKKDASKIDKVGYFIGGFDSDLPPSFSPSIMVIEIPHEKFSPETKKHLRELSGMLSFPVEIGSASDLNNNLPARIKFTTPNAGETEMVPVFDPENPESFETEERVIENEYTEEQQKYEFVKVTSGTQVVTRKEGKAYPFVLGSNVKYYLYYEGKPTDIFIAHVVSEGGGIFLDGTGEDYIGIFAEGIWEDDFVLVPPNSKEFTASERELLSKVTEWQNEILKSPFEFRYYPAGTTREVIEAGSVKSETMLACVRRYPERLTADLSKEKKSGESC